MEYTARQICDELKIQKKTFDLIIKYLKIKCERKYHEKARKICDFYNDNQYDEIKVFLNNPNRRALLLEFTRIEKYGSLDNFYKIKNEKSRKTKKERYGNENYVNSEKISKSHKKSWNENKESRIAKTKKTKLERYNDENYNNTEKNKKTKIKNHGSVENAHKIILEKSKTTKKKRYNDENYVNSEKTKKTKLERYGNETYNNHEKAKSTNIKKYGTSIPTKNKSIALKISDTWNDKSEKDILEFIKKIEETKFERYGDIHYVNADKCSETWKSKSNDEINDINNKRMLSVREKYGVDYVSQCDDVREKIKHTNLKRYGAESPFQNNDIKDKIKKSNIENLGVEYPMQNKNVQKKSQETNLKKYGVKFIGESKKIQEKIKQSNLKHFGTEYPFQDESIKNKIKEKEINKLNLAKSKNLLSIDDLINKFNKDKTTILKVIDKININIIRFESDNRYYIDESDIFILEDYFMKTEMSGTSYSEKQVADFIKNECGFDIVENSKTIIPPKELDIYVPQKKVAIEFNGLFWHNEMHLDKNYHLNKTIECEKKNIDLIHVFEDDWRNKQDIVKSMIASRLGVYERKIYARKCKCKIIDDKRLARNFLNENHLQGYAECTIFIGLFYNDELLQCMGFNEKGWHDGNTELTRMATKLNIQVIGGFSKMMSFADKQLGFKNITSYIYRAWFSGKGYKASGFNIVKKNPPSYYYIVDFHKIHKSHFRKNKIKRMHELGLLQYYDENKSEHEMMIKNGIYRIYDCGTIKAVYNKI